MGKINPQELLEGIVVDETERFGKRCNPSKDGTIACASRYLNKETEQIDDAVVIFGRKPDGSWGVVDEYGKESAKNRLKDAVKDDLPPSPKK